MLKSNAANGKSRYLDVQQFIMLILCKCLWKMKRKKSPFNNVKNKYCVLIQICKYFCYMQHKLKL